MPTTTSRSRPAAAPELPLDVLCRIAHFGAGTNGPDDLTPQTPFETPASFLTNWQLTGNYFISDCQEGSEGAAALAKAERHAAALALQWQRCRDPSGSGSGPFVAALRLVCRAWRDAVTAAFTCLPAWLLPEAATHPVGPWPHRARGLCIRLHAAHAKDMDMASLERQAEELTAALRALYPGLMHLHFQVIDLIPLLNSSTGARFQPGLIWRVSSVDEARDQCPLQHEGGAVSPLLLHTQLLPAGPLELVIDFSPYEHYGWRLKAEGEGVIEHHELQFQDPPTLQTLMLAVKPLFLRYLAVAAAAGEDRYIEYSFLMHEGGNCLSMYVDDKPCEPLVDELDD